MIKKHSSTIAPLFCATLLSSNVLAQDSPPWEASPVAHSRSRSCCCGQGLASASAFPRMFGSLAAAIYILA
jgi:hypothetical protein